MQAISIDNQSCPAVYSVSLPSCQLEGQTKPIQWADTSGSIANSQNPV